MKKILLWLIIDLLLIFVFSIPEASGNENVIRIFNDITQGVLIGILSVGITRLILEDE